MQLCVLKCAPGAIRLHNYEQLEALIEKYKHTEASRSFGPSWARRESAW